MKIRHLKDHIIIPALENTDFCSDSAINLLLLTAGCESDFGEYLKQEPTGPAISIYQIEQATYNDTMFYLDRRNDLMNLILKKCYYEVDPPLDALIHNLKYATLIARVIYYRRPEPLPDSNDWEGLAHYWKKNYNTYLGAGTVEKALKVAERIQKELQ